MLVTGDAGIGKSRLVAELLAQARATGAITLQARCYEAERSLFLQPIVEVIRGAVAAVAPDVARRAAGDRARTLTALCPIAGSVLRPRPYEAASAEIERRRSFEAVAGFLAGLARGRPVLVAFDDLHLAGTSTVELVHFALRWEPSAPVLIVGTLRRDDAADVTAALGTLAASIDLGPLPTSAVRLLAEQCGQPERAEAVFTRTRRPHAVRDRSAAGAGRSRDRW